MFESVKHRRLFAMALAGAGWWLIGLLLWFFGPPAIRVPFALVHFLGLGTVAAVGVLYGILWWASFLRSKL